MKILLSLALLFTSMPAFASLPVFICHNGAVGADFYAAFYAGRVAYIMNPSLRDVLARQGVQDANRLADAGRIDLHDPQYGTTFSLQTEEGLLTLRRDGNGFRMSVQNGANFYFNPGECQLSNNI